MILGQNGEQDVLELDVPVANAENVQLVQPVGQLVHDSLALFLFQASVVPALHVLVNVFPLTELHDYVDVVPSLDQVQQAAHTLQILQGHQNGHFPANPFQTLSLRQFLLFVDLDGYFLLLLVIEGLPDLSVGSLANDFANIEPVLEVQSALGILEVGEVSHDLQHRHLVLPVIQNVLEILLFVLHQVEVHLFMHEIFQLLQI